MLERIAEVERFASTNIFPEETASNNAADTMVAVVPAVNVFDTIYDAEESNEAGAL